MTEQTAAENMASYLGYSSMAEFLASMEPDPTDQEYTEDVYLSCSQPEDEVLDGEETFTAGYEVWSRMNEYGRRDTTIIWDGEFIAFLPDWKIWVTTCPDPQAAIDKALSEISPEWEPILTLKRTKELLTRTRHHREV